MDKKRIAKWAVLGVVCLGILACGYHRSRFGMNAALMIGGVVGLLTKLYLKDTVFLDPERLQALADRVNREGPADGFYGPMLKLMLAGILVPMLLYGAYAAVMMGLSLVF